MAVTTSKAKEGRTQQLVSPACQRHLLLLLQMLSIVLLAGVLVTILTKGSKAPSQQGEEKIYQELTQLKAGVHRLCRLCPWDWTIFQGNCYFLSVSQRNWTNAVTACQEAGAQLVVIKSHEEEKFLQQISKKQLVWIGLSDRIREDTWQWVDGSPLSPSFWKYWNEGEPNDDVNEDCAEFRGGGWNDNSCHTENFWICKKSAASCSHKAQSASLSDGPGT